MLQEETADVSLSHSRLLELLRERGPQTLDSLCAVPDLGWAQVLMAVDHLSRSQQVSLEMIAPREYRVSLMERQEP
ncbi:MAG: hypothetical protein NBKEAIPA_01561 [Nitrospirae bacterium]|nr:MAG: hypothetical protein UZ03_NOB001000690 [Nitrospira sp. OLB3]MBV6469659.1 hypothetical protein [Nitrospirota bacterium]